MEDYKEKYEMALEGIQEILSSGEDSIKMSRLQLRLQGIFPELKESKDEKIRKAFIKYCKLQQKANNIGFCGISLIDAIAWLEKQGEQPSAIRWYDVSLIPQEMEELLVEWDSEDATWHEIAFYHADTKTFWNGTRQVENVTRWCYIIDLLEKQGEQKPVLDFKASNFYVSKVDGKIHDITYNSTDKVEPKFKIGDVLCDKSCTTLNKNSQPNIKILDIRNAMYICNNCSFPISQQDEYELVTRKNEQQYAWSDEDEKRIDCICDFVWKNRKGDTDEIYQQEQDVKWLKLLKDRAIWKPSREQMEIFKELIDDNTERFFYPTLKSLYNDLKKLKEE